MDSLYHKLMSSTRGGPSMEDLLESVMFDILSRLPVKTIIHCRCVCKKWRNLVSDSYFIDLHLSRSPAGLMFHHNSEKYRPSGYYEPGILKWVLIEDEPNRHHLRHDPVMNLDLNLAATFQNSQMRLVGSVNGLLCLWQFGRFHDNTYICNPITREYMTLPRQQYYRKGYAIIVYGFGVGLRTKEYKVIRTFQGDIPPNPSSTSRPSFLEAEVYTLGTSLWRSLGRVPYWLEGWDGPFLNGRAHWIVCDKDSPEKICTFDFDDEKFELLPSPPFEVTNDEHQMHYQSLGVLKGCLCASDIYGSHFTIWVMKEYGVKKSWRREVVIKEIIGPIPQSEIWDYTTVLECLKDGTVLMLTGEDSLMAYCTLRKTVEDTGLFDRHVTGMTYRPSFLKLQDFPSERVDVF
ncbi:F-box protein At3g07870-like [Bidens hawaiensis]|uniref:F-box protein At3g07870-like n=1 Tax=Bidens hawaiensis TaxID=980011 RepID=UPI0040491FC2